MSNRKVDYVVTSDHGVRTIWIKNHSHKLPLFRSNDEQLIANRIREIQEDIGRASKPHEVVLALYRWAKNHGCVTLMSPVGNKHFGVLRMRPEGDQWIMVMKRGTEEIILARGDRDDVKNRYLKLNSLVAADPTILVTTWNYAMEKHRIELRDAQ